MCIYAKRRTGVWRLVGTTPSLPEDLKHNARAKANREGKNLSLVVRALLAEYIKEDPPEVSEEEDYCRR
jgi:hypothetical protein